MLLEPVASRSDGEQASDELSHETLEPHAHDRALWDAVREMGHHALAARARAARRALRTAGITAAADQETDEGLERVWPFDPIPRLIPAAEWNVLEAGLRQRVRALNRFLHDLYHGQHVLRDGVVPPELVRQRTGFRPEVMGVTPPRGIYTHVTATDVIRDEHGRYVVLDDNVRTPSGAADMLENRLVARRVLPEFFARYRVRPVSDYPAVLLHALRSVSPRGPEDAVVVVLTPGPYNAAWAEHRFLAREMGVELAEGRDLVVVDDVAHLRTTRGLRRVDVVYRRIDDAFLDPRCFRADSLVGVAGIVEAWRAGNVALVNAPGSGIADDQAIYPYVPQLIRYYLGEAPLLDNVPTWQMTDREERAWVLAHLDQVVVKAVGESGAAAMLIGPRSTPAQRAEVARAILERPRNYIAQPVVPLSRHVCYLDGQLEARHIDLRPFVVHGEDITVVPGGLTRVAQARGSLLIGSARGGGSKDSWVLAE